LKHKQAEKLPACEEGPCDTAIGGCLVTYVIVCRWQKVAVLRNIKILHVNVTVIVKACATCFDWRR